jgi:MerR family transcriptional regulator, mercuric resistance operon regulatory protein
MAALTISRLARSAGVGVETVRFYQRRGLMPDPPRPAGPGSGGGTRRYGDEEVRRLRFIRGAQTAGFTLAEIRDLLALDATEERAKARDMARARIEALDEKIAALSAARAALARLADQCASGAAGPCPILAAFEP